MKKLAAPPDSLLILSTSLVSFESDIFHNVIGFQILITTVLFKNFEM